MVIVKLFFLILYAFSFLFKRKKNLWLFGSETGFDGNPKYLYLYILEKHPEICAIWISKRKEECLKLQNRGFKSYYSYSLKGLYFSLRANFYIVSGSLADINFYTSGGAKYVQLWHGIGIKKCLWSNPKSNLNTLPYYIGFVQRPSFYIKPDFILGASSMMNKILAEMLNTDSSKCKSIMYPRCSIFFLEEQQRLEYIKKWESVYMYDLVKWLLAFNKVYIYMPTFRDSNPKFLESQNWDLQILNDELKKNNSVLLIKLHPHMQDNMTFDNFSNMKVLDKKTDIYPILPFTHCLITDYSSIYYDYILMDNKEVLLYIPDLSEYLSKSRELLMDYSENCKGKILNSFEDLLKALSCYNEIDVSSLRHKFWGISIHTTMEDLYRVIKTL